MPANQSTVSYSRSAKPLWDDSPPPEPPPSSSPSEDTDHETGATAALVLELGMLILQRLVFGLLVLLVIIYVTFVGMAMARGAELTVAATTALGETWIYGQRLVQGDLGMSHAATSRLNIQPVTDHLGRLLGRSLGLLGISLLFATLVGTYLGLRTALQRHSNRSLLLVLVSLLGISAPSFFVAIILQYGATTWTRTMGSRLLPIGGFGWDAHLILPTIVLAARPIAQIARVAFVAIGDVLDQEYVRTARSKGLRADAILRRHVYRNAAIPILTTVGVSLRFSLSTLPVVEFFFGWNGAGQMLLRAISFQDHNMAIALLLAFGLLFIAINLLLELAYRLLDPRLGDAANVGHIQTSDAVADLLREFLAWGWRQWLWFQQWLHRLIQGRWLGDWQQRRRQNDPNEMAADQQRMQRAQRTTWRQSTLGNPALMVGGVIIFVLLVSYFFGPQLAPYSPYTTRGIEYKDGALTMPPFAPGDEYRWGTDVMGRDIMSLILAGTEHTLRLAALVVTVRLIIGFTLGALAGWFRGQWLDRTILAVAEVIAAFPMLLLAMLLILSLGIRSGIRPFLIALSLVGWGEIMQFVRSQTITTRPKPYIESAVAVGADTPRLIWTHLLPNLVPALISLAALEMGAVLMLLGELGYIGIFIGGGAFAELNVALPRFQYSDVPEWGSLLSNVRLYARAYPWTALYPALAFFLAILGFNLLGEGLRRLVERVGGHFAQIWNHYTLVTVVVLLVGVGWLRVNTGPMAYYREQAITFDGSAALSHVASLTAPEMAGRALGTSGMALAAQAIADEFQALGLQRAGESASYFQTTTREFQQLNAPPQLAITPPVGETTDLTYRQDFREFAGRFRVQGNAAGSVHFLATGPLNEGSRSFAAQLPRPLRNLDFSDQILLVLSAEDALRFALLPYAGVLVVAPEGDAGEQFLTQAETVPALAAARTNFGGRAIGQEAPILWIAPTVADRILAGSGETVARLRSQVDDLEPEAVLTFDTGSHATMAVDGTTRTGVEVVNVIGHLPAVEGQNIGGQMIVVMAPYDTPPQVPGTRPMPAANDNASGLALMVELIRTMSESGYQPYKTFLFVAYAAEGAEGGEPVSPPDVEKFLEAKAAFSGNFTIEAVVTLQGVGGGNGDRLAIEAGGSLRLADLFADAAQRVGVSTVRVGSAADLSAIFEAESQRGQTQAFPQVALHWDGWQQTRRSAKDTLDGVDGSTLEQAGQAITLALMTIGRETHY